jgi:hypothetical protein
MFTVTVSSIIYGAWWIEVANVSGNTDSECAWLFLITWWSCHHVTCFSIYPYLVKRISPMHEIRNDSKPSLDENPLLFWEVSAGVSFYIVTELTYTDKQKKKPFLWIGLRSDLFFVVCIIFFFSCKVSTVGPNIGETLRHLHSRLPIPCRIWRFRPRRRLHLDRGRHGPRGMVFFCAWRLANDLPVPTGFKSYVVNSG